MHVFPLCEGPVGGGPQGLRLADERVKLAARSAETIVDLILVILSQLRLLKTQIFEGSFTTGTIGDRGMLKDALDEYLSAATEGKPRNSPR